MSGVNFNVTTSLAGTGSGTGINYGSSEAGQYTGYADAAAATPVDMTGGSPTLTLASTTSTPLRGAASLLITKDAANRQGEGFADAITIDDADKCKVLTISFDYEIASGTYADGDLTVYVYDVTNSTLIQPAGYSIRNVGIESKHIATFQTTTSTSYRWGFHVASTSASAYTVKVDNVSVGPQAQLYGAPVSDWTAYTPTVAGFTSNNTPTGFWRRVGDTMEVEAKISFTGSPAGSAPTLSLPSGYSIDTAKLPAYSASHVPVFGYGVAHDVGSGVYLIHAMYSSTTAVLLREADTTGNNLFSDTITGTDPFTPVSGDYIEIKFSVPIAGWSSAVQMSNDTDTREVSMVATSTTTSCTTGNTTAIVYPTVVKDTHGAYNSTTGIYTVQVPGRYCVNATFEDDSSGAAAAEYTNLLLYKNGSNHRRLGYVQYSGTATVSAFVGGMALVDCIAGDTLAVRLDNTMGETLVGNGSAVGTHFEIFRLSGPATIAASENIYFEYNSNAGGAQTGGTTNIDWSTKVVDSHGSFNGTTFTCPSPGTYHFSGSVFLTASVATSVNLYKNGVANKRCSQNISDDQQCFNAQVTLIAGDTVTFRLSDNATLSSNATVHWIAGHRI